MIFLIGAINQYRKKEFYWRFWDGFWWM